MRGRVLAAAVAATLVAGVVSAVARAADDPGTASVAVRQAPAPPAPPTPGPPTEVLTPTARPTPDPRPTVRPTAPELTKRPRTPSAPPVPPVVPPRRATKAPPAPVRDGHWLYREQGVVVDVRVVPASPRAGDLVTWTVVTTDASGRWCCGTGIEYSDGQGAYGRFDACADRVPTAASQVATYRHAYRRAGSYRARLHVYGACEGPVRFEVNPTVVVRDGPLLANGPSRPTAWLDDSIAHSGADPDAGRYFVSESHDHDGWPASVTYDWGDGTPPTVVENPNRCRYGPLGGWAESDQHTYVAHRFAVSGTVTVRLTAVSAGCDGEQPQTATASVTLVVARHD